MLTAKPKAIKTNLNLPASSVSMCVTVPGFFSFKLWQYIGNFSNESSGLPYNISKAKFLPPSSFIRNVYFPIKTNIFLYVAHLIYPVSIFDFFI